MRDRERTLEKRIRKALGTAVLAVALILGALGLLSPGAETATVPLTGIGTVLVDASRLDRGGRSPDRTLEEMLAQGPDVLAVTGTFFKTASFASIGRDGAPSYAAADFGSGVFKEIDNVSVVTDEQIGERTLIIELSKDWLTATSVALFLVLGGSMLRFRISDPDGWEDWKWKTWPEWR